MDEKILTQLSIELGKKLRQQKLWVTCAESCTGGWLAKAISDIAGSSAYFDRSFVTYSNKAKHQMLGVSETTLQQYGAVSEQVVREMAAGALQAAHADLAVSVSGIAGPDGGSEEKPVGTVWFGFAYRTINGIEIVSRHCCFNGDRNEIRLQSAIYSLKTLLSEIIKN
ncbi:nicotinamide-nucleotide amidase [Photorhabdus khanii]|uniref:Nicotinamide-nucleotide amidase n=1 Tax=Photorhabdus khanii subsp. guanajuatensis TaxID=2100166 RepID=A0A4R4J6I2_9GAMM|nr:nicotinamide-nucleotide amidase [Photorhabdus khanii]TDB48831.1 nicotinamide-nucleotide amidase [Photorhabdus khanii subsp. guanajuatensis]